MYRSTTFAALLAAGAVLGACSTTSQQMANLGVDSVNQPVVQRTDYVLDLSAYDGRVADAELDRLSAWFQSLELGYGDTVWVDEPRNNPNQAARDDVARVAGDYGLMVAEGAPVTVGEVPQGYVRVIVSRMTASVPGCPNWSDAGELAPNSHTSPNFGCAINSNLAAMVADPTDLVRGQTGSGNGTGATGTKAIRIYRDATPTGTQGLTATSTTRRNQ